MIKNIIFILLLLSSGFAISLNFIGTYDPVALAMKFHQQGRQDEAMDVIDFALENGQGDTQKLKRLKDDYKYGVAKRSKDLLYNGALKGEVYNMWSAVGCIAADCLVVGDIRDLTKEGYHYATGQEVDKIVAALSALGVATTAAEATGGGVVVDAGVSVIKTSCKYARKAFKVIPESILKVAIEGGKFSAKSYKYLWSIYKETGFNIQSFTTILSKVKKVQDLPHVSKIVSSLKRGGFVFLSRTGESGIWLFKKFGDSVLTGFKLNPRAVIGLTKLHTGIIGLGKAIYKNGFVTSLLTGICFLGLILNVLPLWLLVLIFALSILCLFKINPFRLLIPRGVK